ncbi:MAG: Tex-like N-terminal domain-containing protein [Thermoguttaceae bacterium]|nr:Tex-like N-terminal domain-containing protein [Thermoguttaceae bacterium]
MIESLSVSPISAARELGLPLEQVKATFALIEEGYPVVFIARYRKDQTQNLDEEGVLRVAAAYQKQRQLTDRKYSYLKTIEAQGKLTPELEKKIREARSPRRLDDLYLPFRSKRDSLAQAARDKGLMPLAEAIMNAEDASQDLNALAEPYVDAEKGVANVEEALKGAADIIAEIFAENFELRCEIRDVVRRTGKLITKKIEKLAVEETTEADAAAEPEKPAETQAAEPAEPVEAPPAEPVEAQADAPAEPVEAQAAEPVEAQAAESTEPVETQAAETAEPVEAQVAESAEPVEAQATETAEPVEAQVAESADPAETQTTDAAEPADAKSVEAPAVAPVAATKAGDKKAEDKKKKKSAKEQRQAQVHKQYADYFDAKFILGKIPANRVFAMNRAEAFKIISIKLDVDVDSLKKKAREILVAKTHPFAEFLTARVDDGLTNLALPAIEKDARRDTTDRAEEQTANAYAKNLRNLLMQRPLEGRRVLAIDPSFRSGSALVALDENGALLSHETVFFQGSAERRAFASTKMVEMIETFNLSVIAIGNGMGSRDAENFVSQMIEEHFADKEIAYILVNEAGASAYSSSQAAVEEFPNVDPFVREAVSIGRRLQNPLNELVKIDPERLGVGMGQLDARSKALKEALTTAVSFCVNKVGVELNAATPAVLRYVEGLNPLTAKRVYEYRVEKDGFQSREQLKEVSGLGELAFTQCSGFLKIADAANPFDATWIHPESYELAAKILEKFGLKPEDIHADDKREEVAAKVAEADAAALAEEFGAGPSAVAYLLEQFVKPGADPREDLPGPIFKKGTMKLEDLKPGMELTGTVLRTADFGVFVDVGVSEAGLVHISRLGKSYVSNVRECVSIGEVLKVWVVDVDLERRRISLTTLEPGTVRERRPDRRPRRESAGGEEQQRRERRPRRTEEGGEARRERPQRRGRDERADRQPRTVTVAPKDVSITPISEDMKAGKEPMRSFSDLAQFFGKVEPNDKEEEK